MMRLPVAMALSPLLALAAGAQSSWHCSCGSNPPPPPAMRTVSPYAGEPEDLRPFSKFTMPYYQHYEEPNIYSGAARDVPAPDLKTLKEIRIGFIGPIGNNPEHVLGERMLRGVQLAIDEANAGGGYGGKPFRLMLHNDYDNWQANQVYGSTRPTDPEIWGAAAGAVAKMVYDENVWAIFGSISSETTHIALRAALRAEVPIVNSASTDPTIPETLIPWYFTDIQDDRVQCLTLARHIFTELGLKRVAILRVNNRYGRFGVPKLRDASRRLGHPIVIEQKYLPGDTDFRHQLRVIQESRTDGIVLWADQAETAAILKQMREMGMKQRVFGSHRTIGADMLQLAGPAAEGFEAVYPFNPQRNDPRWIAFQKSFKAKYNEEPEQFAALAYDAAQAMLSAICKAGLNRARIHDALADMQIYNGVTADMVFDPNSKNTTPMFLATVHDGKITYRRATMEKEPTDTQKSGQSQSITPAPYARVGEDGVTYSGPTIANPKPGLTRIAVFGPNAEEAVRTPEMQQAITQAEKSGQRISLIGISTEAAWGKSSSKLVDAIYTQHVISILALDRDSSHLAEQLALKSFVPVVAIASDKSLTSTNIPWIFRLPAETPLPQALSCLTAAIRKGGSNPEKIRDVLASGKAVAGFQFESTGEPKVALLMR
ncbi:MAG TPA: ABC transporter substrate-binding protein [Acidisarcina sp.]|nr:ABC transporter substrate-binding protein [Acidisarcina sp.]